jgi:DNA invertase Pin-like site-specific DNA recombinase
MALYGYARVSTVDQDLTVQIEALKAAGCVVIRMETASGTSRERRPELTTLLEFIREGDVLVVTRIDRLARSIGDLQDIVRLLKAKKATVRATEQPFNTGDIYGEMTMNILGVFADFETKLRRERQLEGIAAAKAAGVYRGRKPSIDEERVRQLHAQGIGATAIARTLGIGRASVYRVLGRTQER